MLCHSLILGSALSRGWGFQPQLLRLEAPATKSTTLIRGCDKELRGFDIQPALATNAVNVSQDLVDDFEVVRDPRVLNVQREADQSRAHDGGRGVR